MVKAKESKGGSKNKGKTCTLCKKMYQSVVFICGNCDKKLKGMEASPSDSFDRALFEVITKSKARDRKSSAQKLAIETKPASDTSKATIMALKKKVKALNDRLRKIPARLAAKATHGFK